VIRSFVIRNFVIRNFAIRNFVPVPLTVYFKFILHLKIIYKDFYCKHVKTALQKLLATLEKVTQPMFSSWIWHRTHFHRGNISSLIGNIGSNKCCLYLEAICKFKDSKFLDTVACTKCSVPPPSHINRFTVTPQHTLLLFQSPSADYPQSHSNNTGNLRLAFAMASTFLYGPGTGFNFFILNF
jgi:hypothetical protein